MKGKPNYLIIMSDQHAPSAMAGAGHPTVKTPNLDRLMASGVAFSRAYASYPMCTPSRASFMTGHLTPQLGVWELGTPLRSDLPTWAHVLRREGYTTSISGRMHFVGCDKRHGFERRVYPDVSEMPTPFTYGDWDRPQGDDHVMVEAVGAAGPVDTPTRAEQFDRAVTDAALAEIDALAASADGKPWALMVGFFLPHFPYRTSRGFYDLYDGIEIPLPRKPPEGQTCESLVPDLWLGARKWLGLTADGISEDQVRMARRCYYGMVSCMDEQIGRLLAHLEDIGVGDDTWIVYLSDHGDNLGEHGFWSKLNFFEESVGIPLIVVPPAYERAGARCAAPVSILDWMPTVLELTGHETYFEELPGRSLVPLIRDPALQWLKRTIVADYACDGTRVPMRMVRRGRWKAAFAPGLPATLHDMERDPHEWRDLGDDASSQETLKELEAAARADGWDPAALTDAILTHKRRLTYINTSETAAE